MAQPSEPPGQSTTEVQAIDNLASQVQSLQLQVTELNANVGVLNSHLEFDIESLELGLYYAIFFFVLGLIFGVAASIIRRTSRY